MKRVFFFFAFITLLYASVQSQGIKAPKLSITPADTVVNDSLIFSEMYIVDWWQWGYVEVTNMSSKPMNLGNYFMTWRTVTNALPFIGDAEKTNLWGTLAPGKSILFGFSNLDVDKPVDAYNNLIRYGGYNLNRYLYNLIDTNVVQGNARYKIFQLWARKFNAVSNTIDSVRIENFNGDNNLVPYTLPIAGISKSESKVREENVSQAKVWIRKMNVKRGNAYRVPAITNAEAWTNSRGTDEVDSEWIPIPKNSFSYENLNDIPFTTVKQHGIGSLSTIVPKNGITIDLNQKIITIPYGVRRDSVFRSFTFGPNLAWMYKNNSDTFKYFTQTGDSIFFYTMGNSKNETKFKVITLSQPTSSTEIASRLYVAPNNANLVVKDYEITQGKSPMDSISFVPYACRVDSFLKNIIIPDGASTKFTYIDGVERPDLKTGDIITVTAKDGTTKKPYLISCVPYRKNSDATIKTMIFPGLELWTSKLTYLPTDTMYTFTSVSYFNNIPVDKDLAQCPEFIAIPGNPRAKIDVTRAKNLNGTEEDRTLTLKVTAEDDTTVTTYRFTFSKVLPTPELDYTPFFTDFYKNTGNATWVDGPNALYNPKDESLDLSDYMIAMVNNQTIDNYMKTVLVNDTNKWTLRPGYKVVRANGLPVFKEDLSQNSVIIPAKSSFAWSRRRGWPNEGVNIPKPLDKTNPLIAKLDFTVWTSGDIPAYAPDVYGTKLGLMNAWTLFGSGGLSTRTICLYKIKDTPSGDSIRDGIKPMNDLVNDYELIDIVGGGWGNSAKPWTIYDKTADGKSLVKTAKTGNDILGAYRKPGVWKGNPVDGLSFGIGNDTLTILQSEWTEISYVGGDGQRNNKATNAKWINTFQGRYKNHTMVVTANIPYLTSATYKISTDIVGLQSIEGVAANTTTNNFLSNVVLADPGMSVKVKTAAGVLKTGADVIVTGDMVTSYSARGIDSVIYKVSTGSFDNNIALTSSDYTITIAGDKKTGKISGIKFGTTAKEVASKLVKPSKATMLLTDGAKGIVSMYTLPSDSNKFKLGERNELIANEKLFVTVNAENGDECVYSLEFTKESTPYILSDKYEVRESEKYINYVNYVIVRVFLANLKPAPGFAVKVVNKMGQDRLDGDVRFDDQVVVYDPNNMANSTTYAIKFKDDLVFGVKSSKATLGIEAYPNPTSGKFVVKAKKMTQIDVTDITGRNVYSVKTTANEATINLSKENAGIYLVTVRNNDTMETMKVLKN